MINTSATWTLELLRRRGLISPADEAFGRPTVEETSISHRSYLVRLHGKPRWFVKSADPARSQGRDLGMESTVHRLAPLHPPLAEVVPRCRLVSFDGSLLVLEAVDGEPLRHTIFGDDDHSSMRAYGLAVARTHQTKPPRFGQPPWMLSALQPRWGKYEWLPQSCGVFLRRLAASPFTRAAFDTARRQWRPGCLVHGDLRWANALLDRGRTPPKVWLVDWELACVGDPAWDLGSVIADVAASSAFAGLDASDQKRVLSLCHPFLSAYLGEIRPMPDAWNALLGRSVLLAGIRLVQTVIEHGHSSVADLLQAERLLLPAISGFLGRAPLYARHRSVFPGKEAPG